MSSVKHVSIREDPFLRHHLPWIFWAQASSWAHFWPASILFLLEKALQFHFSKSAAAPVSQALVSRQQNYISLERLRVFLGFVWARSRDFCSPPRPFLTRKHVWFVVSDFSLKKISMRNIVRVRLPFPISKEKWNNAFRLHFTKHFKRAWWPRRSISSS